MQVGILLRLPYLALERRVEADLAAAGFTDFRPAHNQVLQHLPPAPEGVRLTDLAAAAHITKQSMQALVADLEKLGYVKRSADPTDGRAQLIQRTAKAQHVYKAVEKTLAAAEAEWARQLGKRRLDELKRTLADLCDALAP